MLEKQLIISRSRGRRKLCRDKRDFAYLPSGLRFGLRYDWRILGLLVVMSDCARRFAACNASIRLYDL